MIGLFKFAFILVKRLLMIVRIELRFGQVSV